MGRMERRRNTLYCLLICVCAVVLAGLLYELIGIKIATSVAYTTDVGRYVFPFGVVHWWDGYIAGVVWSLFFCFFTIRANRRIGFPPILPQLHEGTRAKAIVATALTYTAVMAYFALPTLLATEIVTNDWYILLSPFIIFGQTFVTSIFFFVPIYGLIEITIGLVSTSVPPVVKYFQEPTYSQS